MSGNSIYRPEEKNNNKNRKLENKTCLTKLITYGDPYNKYELKEKIGSGGAADVYRAINKHTAIEVAIKRILIEKQDLKDITTELKGDYTEY